MDKEDARFILRCFRPDGADAETPEFAEALAWAAKDRELGEWLAQERSADAGFARALTDLTLPDALRDEILQALALQRGEPQILANSLDRAAIGAMAAIAPPPALRAEVLAAMARTAGPSKRPWWYGWRIGFPLAAAAGIALAVVLSTPHKNVPPADLSRLTPPSTSFSDPELEPERQGVAIPASATITIGAVERDSIRTLESAAFTSDPDRKDGSFPFDHVNPGQKLPCPSTRLPEGLRKIPGVGFRDLTIDGKQGVLVCYQEDEKLVHLVVFKRCDVICRLPAKDHPDFAQDGKWVVARWADENWVYMLLGGDGVAEDGLKNLF